MQLAAIILASLNLQQSVEEGAAVQLSADSARKWIYSEGYSTHSCFSYFVLYSFN